MKIIDLFNEIATNGDIPKKVQFHERVYIYDSDILDYYEDNEESDNESLFLELFHYYSDVFNKEVEIIEYKPKEIEKIYHCELESKNEEIQLIVKNMNDLSDKLNEIIDKINKERKENEDN